MLEQSRLRSKRISKTESVQSQLDTPLAEGNIHIGPSDYVPWQKDNKVCFMRLEYRGFGDTPMNIELRLSVEDSPNSAGMAIDCIRCAKLALDRGIGGPLHEISAFTMKHRRSSSATPRPASAWNAGLRASSVGSPCRTRLQRSTPLRSSQICQQPHEPIDIGVVHGAVAIQIAGLHRGIAVRGRIRGGVR